MKEEGARRKEERDIETTQRWGKGGGEWVKMIGAGERRINK